MPITIIPKIPQATIAPPNPLDEEAVLTYVFSFKSRTGDVSPATNDYSASMIGNDSGVTGGNVSAALDQLDSDIDGLSSVYQPLDAGLTSIAGLTTAADKMIYTTASDTYAVTSLTAYGRSLLDDADAGTARGTLDAVGGRSVLTLNTIPKADASGDAVNSSITDDGSTVTIGGNLDVTGTTTTFDSTVVAIGDSLMKYAKDNTATDIIDIGWYGVYGSGGTKYSGMFRDASDGKFNLYSGLEVEPTTTVNKAGSGYTLGNLVIGTLDSTGIDVVGNITVSGTVDGVDISALDTDDVAYCGTHGHIATMQDVISHQWSAGTSDSTESEFVITEVGDGSINITAGSAVLRATNSPHGDLCGYALSAVTGMTFVDGKTNYIMADYNSGSPQLLSTDNPAIVWGDQTKAIIYAVNRLGTQLNIVDFRGTNIDFIRKNNIKDAQVRGTEHASGAFIADEGSRNISITAGSFYLLNSALSTPALDTSVAGTFEYLYRDGASGWTRVASQTQINVTQYDDDSGTLATLSNNKYGVHYVYAVLNTPSHYKIVYGIAEYASLSDAQAAELPAELPSDLDADSTAEFVGKIIIRKSVDAFEDIQSPYTQALTSATASTHNALAGLQGGTVDEYYHLTSTDYTAWTTTRANLTTQYRMGYVSAAGVLTESSTLKTNATGNLIIDTGANSIALTFDDNSVTNRFQFNDGGNPLDTYFKANADSTRAAHIQAVCGSLSCDVTSGFGRNGFEFTGADFYLRSAGNNILRVSTSAAANSLYLDGSSNFLVGTVSGSGTAKMVVNGYIAQDGVFAEIHTHDASTAQTIATGATYTKSTAFTDNGQSSNCTADVANDKITITKAGRYRIEGTFSFTSDTNNVIIKGSAFVGGVESDNVHWERKVGTGADVGNAGFTGFIDIPSDNTDVDFRMAHDAVGAVDITISYANMNVSYLGKT